MEVTVHRVSDIRLERTEYETFSTVTVTVTDKYGDETEFKMFSNDENPINIKTEFTMFSNDENPINIGEVE